MEHRAHMKRLIQRGGNRMRYAIREGNYAKMGTVVTNAGTIFTFEGKKEADCAILLYRMKTGEITRIEVPKEYCIGSLRSCLVEKLDIRHYQYIMR